MAYNEALDVVHEFMEALARQGVRHICVAPGSRSAPLTIAAARTPDLRLWLLLDERSAAFFALGLAKSTKCPAVVVCTSGTAVANLAPALLEAFMSRVPLLALTADRPPELRDVGANQTVRQPGMFAGHVKWHYDMPVPDGARGLSAHARATAGRAVAAALSAPAGPVHINWPFREPLLPVPRLRADDAARDAPPRRSGSPADASTHPAVTSRADAPAFAPRSVSVARARPAPGVCAALAAELAREPRGIIVCGPQEDALAAAGIRRLAARLGYPLLADPLSQLRGAPQQGDAVVIDAYDAWLHICPDALAGELRPQVVLRFGAAPTSRALGDALSGSWSASRQIVFDEAPVWRDPWHAAEEAVIADVGEAAAALCESLAGGPSGGPAWPEASATWIARWRTLDRAAADAIERALAVLESEDSAREVSTRECAALFEGLILPRLADLLPAGAGLFVGNSMPVRDADLFWRGSSSSLRLFGNRGVSGIDGIDSTAFGVAAGLAPDPVAVYLGDISFYHDLNGLLAARLGGLSLTIVVANNDGGGIFAGLPPAGETDVYPYFETPHGLDFSGAVATFGGRFRRVRSWDELAVRFVESLATPGLDVIEVPTDRTRDKGRRERVRQAVGEEVGEYCRRLSGGV